MLITSVTANGALHFCVQSLIVGGVGTAVVVMLDGSTAWPLIAYTGGMAALTLGLLTGLARRKR